MAEALLRGAAGDAVVALSAGSHPRAVHPEAVMFGRTCTPADVEAACRCARWRNEASRIEESTWRHSSNAMSANAVSARTAALLTRMSRRPNSFAPAATIAQTVARLRDDRFAVWVIGDVRDAGGFFVNLEGRYFYIGRTGYYFKIFGDGGNGIGMRHPHGGIERDIFEQVTAAVDTF